MCSSDLCPVESVLQNRKKWQVCKTYQLKSVFPSPLPILLQLLNLKVKGKYLLPLTTFCDKIRARMQRTNYIYNTDPSNPALSKAQISNYPVVPYICMKNPKKLSHPFSLSPFQPLFHHKICSNLCLKSWIWLAGQYFKTLFRISIPKQFKHNRNQSQFPSVVQSS